MYDPLKSKTRVLFSVVIAALLGVGGASAIGWTALTANAAISLTPQVSDAQVQPALDLSEAFVNLAEVVTPAVIRIEAERPGVAGASPQGMPEVPEEFRDFFEPFGLPDDPNGVPEPMTAGGSGFIISPDGYILTNDHVVSGATRIRVFLADRREYVAEIIGSDPTTDVAVIKINGEGLPTLSLGSSSGLRVGELVLAIGNPGLGGGASQLDYTVTQGIVSALGRGLPVIREGLFRQEGEEAAGYAIEDFIQTDAVINPGNSGGPLVDVRGQVIGINSAIASRTGYYQGYGFAIPIDLARRIMEDLIDFGEVRRAYLGIQMEPVSPVDAEYYGLPRTTGVIVMQAVEGGPAAAAGLQREDIIVSVDGEPVERSAQLQSIIAQKRPGDEARIQYYREGRSQEVTIRLGQSPLGARSVAAAPPGTAAPSLLGMEFRPLDAQTAQELGYAEPGGVIVGPVTQAGPAGRAGIRPGQRVVAIGGSEVGQREAVSSIADVNRILAGFEGGDIVSFELATPDGSSAVRNLRIPQ
ncbi:MAG: trypsin-like peptidase domain-containing protein [Gemmatimonadota bacterium]